MESFHDLGGQFTETSDRQIDEITLECPQLPFHKPVFQCSMDNGVLIFHNLSAPPAKCGGKDLEGIVRIGSAPHKIVDACQDQKDPQNLNITPSGPNMSEGHFLSLIPKKSSEGRWVPLDQIGACLSHTWFSKRQLE